jgi:hypothetical protein
MKIDKWRMNFSIQIQLNSLSYRFQKTFGEILVIHHYEETANVKQKQHLKAIHNKIAIEWFAIELHCSAAIMPVFWILIQILAILIENNILKSRLIFRFSLSGGKKKIEKTIQMKYFKIKSLFFLIMKKGTHKVHSKVQWFSFL